MSSKLVPSDPASVMVIRDVVPRVITTLSVPFWRFGRVKIGGRGTIGMLCPTNTSHATANAQEQCASNPVPSPSSLLSH